MKNQYKIALHTKDCMLFYNEDYNFFSEKNATIYTNKRKAAEKMNYALKYGTSLSGVFKIIKIE